MTKLKKLIIVLALVSLTLTLVPGKVAIADPARIEEIVEVVEEKKVDVVGSKFDIVIPEKSVIAFKNNNPGNLRFAGQIGATKGYKGFAYFENKELGFKALLAQIRLDSSRGLTIAQFVHKFAPPVENDTHIYLDQVIKYVGVTADTLLSDAPHNILAIFMAKKESETIVKILP